MLLSPSLVALVALCPTPQAPAPAQDEFLPGRFGAYAETVDNLRGPVDAVALEDGALLVVERDADRLTRIGADGARAPFGPSDLDAPEDVERLRGGGFAVADTGADRVVLLNATGEVTAILGRRGSGPAELRAPAGVAVGVVSGNDELYVADAGNGRVSVFALDTRTPTRALGGLTRPVAVALAPDGRAFVLDAGAHRVVVFAADGARQAEFGDFGPHAGFLGHPRDLEIAGERVYVADADNHRVQVFSLGGDYLYEWGKHAFRPREGEGSLHYPSGIALIGSGDTARAVVCEAFGDRLQVFARTEEDPARFMTDPGLMPWKVSPHYGPAIDTAGDLLVIFEPETQTVLVHDLELDEPVEVTRFGAYGTQPGQHTEIVDLLVEEGDWRVLVSDEQRGVISTWSLAHVPDAPLKRDPRMASFAFSRAPLAGRRTGAIARAWDGALAVVDLERAAVVLDTPEGPRTLATFDEPVDLAFDGELAWVADRGARAVIAIDAAGAVRPRLEGFRRPRGVAVARDGEVYVTDEVAHVVRVFGPDAAGAYAERRAFGGEGLGPGQLLRPAGIVLDERDRVVVLDHGNHRGMVFDRAGTFLRAFGPRGYVKPTRR